MRRFLPAMLMVGLGAAWARPNRADDPPAADSTAESARAAEAGELAKAEAGRYRLGIEGAAGRGPIALRPKALLQWSNPVAGSIHGAVFVWTDRGRPAAVGSIYKWFSPNRHLGVELHSLVPQPLTADRDGRRIWSASRPGVEFKPVPGAPAPGESPAARLRQMRALAKAFAATETTRNGVVRELRLLTQPLYRYESTDPEVLDGGLFAFVEGTDPEVILLIEARKAPDGPRWEFASARMNSCAMRLEHEGRAAWSAAEIPWSQARDHRELYSLFIFNPDPGMGAGDDAPPRR